MFHIKSSIANVLILSFLLIAVDASAEEENVDDSTPFTLTPGGKISAEVNKEREESALRNKPGDPVAGREKSQLCQGCHGEVGISANPEFPKLAGQFSNYITKQVRNFQSGKRSNQIMSAMAATINEDDLADVAAYFASQDRMNGNGLTENTSGRKLFSKSDTSPLGLACINCHGEKGQGLEPKISVFPIIGGQHKDYIRQQLINFRDGDRTNSPNGMMNKMASSLSDAQIEALAEYISQQPVNIAASSQTSVDNPTKTHKSRTK
jgi:cytochrome c553